MLTLCVCEIRIPFHFVSCKLYVNTMCEHDLTWFLSSFFKQHIFISGHVTKRDESNVVQCLSCAIIDSMHGSLYAHKWMPTLRMCPSACPTSKIFRHANSLMWWASTSDVPVSDLSHRTFIRRRPSPQPVVMSVRRCLFNNGNRLFDTK